MPFSFATKFTHSCRYFAKMQTMSSQVLPTQLILGFILHAGGTFFDLRNDGLTDSDLSEMTLPPGTSNADMHGNAFTLIPAGFFTSSSSPWQICLNNNQIAHIDDHAFSQVFHVFGIIKTLNCLAKVLWTMPDKELPIVCPWISVKPSQTVLYVLIYISLCQTLLTVRSVHFLKLCLMLFSQHNHKMLTRYIWYLFCPIFKFHSVHYAWPGLGGGVTHQQKVWVGNLQT